MKILIVEDDVNIRRSLIRLLRRMFDEIDPWATGYADEAVTFLRDAMLDKAFDLVICDWNLAGAQTGGHVLEWIREHASYLEARFLFLSANEASQKLGVRWVDKVSDVPVLRAAIQAAAAGGST
jgi:CheY-like chemotaxis protein